MNVYDFDKTILKEDSSFAFWKFVMKQNIILGIKYGFRAIVARNKWKSGKISREEYKDIEFSYLELIDVPAFVELFIEEEILKINEWYYTKHKSNDVIVSACPTFLLEKFCEKLSVKYFVGSEVDIKTGKHISLNCYGENKIELFREKYGNVRIDEFYSDSLSDTPFAKLAKRAYLVKGDRFKDWKFSEEIKEIEDENLRDLDEDDNVED